MQEHHCAESPSSVSAFGAATFPRGKAGVVAVGLVQVYYIVYKPTATPGGKPQAHNRFGAADKASNNPKGR